MMMKHTAVFKENSIQTKASKARKKVTAVVAMLLSVVLLAGCQGASPTDTAGEVQPPPPEFDPANVIMISVQDLGDGVIGTSYKDTPLTPSINSLLSDFSYYKNNVSASAYAAGLDIVMSSSVYAPQTAEPIVGLQGDKLTTLAKILSEKGFYTLAATTGPEGAYGGKATYQSFGYSDLVTAVPSELERTSVYDKALSKLKSNESEHFFLSITDHGLYTGDTDITARDIGGSGDVANYAKRMAYTDKLIGKFIEGLRSEGLYDDTIIIITGTGAAFSLDDSTAVDGLEALMGGYTLENYIKAPLLMKVPGTEAAASEALVSHSDVLPALAQILGIDTNKLWLNGTALSSGHERIYIQSVLNRGSYIDSAAIVSADSTATASLSALYDRASKTTSTAEEKADEIQKSVAHFEDHARKLAYGLSVQCYDQGTASALSAYEANKDTVTVTEDRGTPDVRPADKDIYKNEVALFNRSVMICANEFEGQFVSVMYKDGGLTLVPGATEGMFISDELDMGGSFKQMLASWNSASTGGTVEVSVAVKLSNGEYTDWFSWGVWSAIKGISGSASTENEHGSVGIDILTLNKECQGIVKFKVDIKQTLDTAPIVYNVTLACDKDKAALSAPDDTYKKLDVPYRRQGDVPEIGGQICSATSLSMVLLYHGEKGLKVEDVAWGVRDYGAGKFGNWSYNVAYAGELGYNAYIDYFDIDAIKWALYTGHPLACSIRVQQGQLASSGFPGYQTNGHLLCVVGYEVKNGQGWLLINDPAHPEVKAILESDFKNIYRGVSYIVQERPEI